MADQIKKSRLSYNPDWSETTDSKLNIEIGILPNEIDPELPKDSIVIPPSPNAGRAN